MAEGFKSPLFLLGIGTSSGNVGYLTPLPIPGIGTETGADEYGFTTPLPVPGIATTPAVDRFGFTTPLPFLNMGAHEYIPPEPEPERNKGGGTAAGRYERHRARLLREDEEVLAVIMAYMRTRH